MTSTNDPSEAAQSRPEDESAGGPTRRLLGKLRHWQVGAAALLVVGVLLGVLGATLWIDRSPTLAASHPTQGRAPAAEASALPHGFAPLTAAAPRNQPVAQHIPPVEVAIPVIRVRSTLVGLRLNPDGTLQVPTDFGKAGWYSDGPAPGDGGPPAVIVGHVDSVNGPAIFYQLSELHAGDGVDVRRADGTTVRFVVYRTEQFPKDAFPANQVYAPAGRPELRLITCTGTFDRNTGHYLGNFVVYAHLQAPAQGAS